MITNDIILLRIILKYYILILKKIFLIFLYSIFHELKYIYVIIILMHEESLISRSYKYYRINIPININMILSFSSNYSYN